MSFQSVRYALGFLALLTLGQPVFAATNVTRSELAMLPGFCDAKIGSKNPAAIATWSKQLGHENWDHMHHYCGGLIELNRYYGGNASQRKKSLRDAMWEFNYVLKYTQPDFYLRADMHYNRGKVWRLQGDDGQAIGDFQKALELSPGMPAATLELADLYKKLGKKGQALVVLKTALENFPDNKGLHRRYVELGGDPALIRPATQSAGETEAAAKIVEPPAGSEAASIAAPADASASDAKIGNATNPWCRFCPDPAPSESDKP